MKADELPSGQKQRDIQEDRADTYGKSREQDIQHLGRPVMPPIPTALAAKNQSKDSAKITEPTVIMP